MLEANQHGIKSNFLSHVISDKAVGTIHSVFNTSFNLIFQKQLIHIGKDSEGVSAFGITLPESLVMELIQAVEVGNRVRWRNKMFTIYTRQKVFTIDTNLFFEFDCRVPQIDTLPRFVIKKFQKLPFLEKTDFYLSERNRILTEKFVLANLGDRDFQEIFIHHFIGRGQGNLLFPGKKDYDSKKAANKSHIERFSLDIEAMLEKGVYQKKDCRVLFDYTERSPLDHNARTLVF